MKQAYRQGLLEKIEEGNSWYTGDQFQAREVYGRTMARRIHFILRHAEGLAAQGDPTSIRVLDAGCGDGVILAELCKLPEAEVWGIEYNPLRLERARKTCQGAICKEADLVRINPREWPVFDLIVSSQVLEHIREDETALRKLVGMLRERGCLIVGVPNEGCFMARLRNRVFERGIGKTTDHINFYTEKPFRKKLLKAGLVIEDILYENFFFPLLRLNTFFSSSDRRFAFMNFLGNLTKSQVAGYYFVCRKV